jgi:hypothetical protein
MRQFGREQSASDEGAEASVLIPKRPRAYAWVVVWCFLPLRTAVEGLRSGLRIIHEDARIGGSPNETGQYKFALLASDNTQIILPVNCLLD